MSKYDFDLDMKSDNSLTLLIKRIKPNSTVLEFGPAHGRMSRYLTEELNCTVYAIEIDEEAAQEAKKYCKDMVIGSASDIQKWLSTYAEIKFDYICFADVLEHLSNPREVLENSKKLLEKNGKILISVPNLAHSAILIDLLNGRFEYKSIGLLDNTHIHLFTKKSLDKMIDLAGLNKSFETATYVSPKNSEFKNDYSNLPTELGAYLKSMPFSEAYQFIYELNIEPQANVEIKYKNIKVRHKFYYYMSLLNILRLINLKWIIKISKN